MYVILMAKKSVLSSEGSYTYMEPARKTVNLGALVYFFFIIMSIYNGLILVKMTLEFVIFFIT